ncbi:SCO4848 family membrane protein [Actinocorallia longicatena]
MTSRRVSGFLIGLAAFMVFEWLMLAKNLGSGPKRETAFYVVHYVLVAFNVVLAGVLAAIGWKAWKSPRS